MDIDALSTDDMAGISVAEFANMQAQDPVWAPMITYLTQGDLPDDTKAARTFVLESPLYEMYEGIRRRRYSSKGRHRHNFVRQICSEEHIPYHIREAYHKSK